MFPARNFWNRQKRKKAIQFYSLPCLDARYGLLKNSEQLEDLKKRISWYQRRKERPYMSYSEETAQAVAEEIARINRLLQERPEQAEETYIPPEEYLAQIKGTMFW